MTALQACSLSKVAPSSEETLPQRNNVENDSTGFLTSSSSFHIHVHTHTYTVLTHM